MKGCLILNRYYTDAGQAYVADRLTECFRLRGIPFQKMTPLAVIGAAAELPDADFAVFWDKDAGLARFLENGGIRVYNPSVAIARCDDKRKTYERFYGTQFPLIPTVFAPLAYGNTASSDGELLDRVEAVCKYPCIVKENIGSLGTGVYLARNRAESESLHRQLWDTPHQYQRRVGTSGADTRVYTIGGKAVAAVKRENPGSFISNAAAGGVTTVTELNGTLVTLSEFAANALQLDYGAIDFLEENGQYFFLEANSNAYFKAAESLGVDIAEKLTEYICKIQSKKILT